MCPGIFLRASSSVDGLTSLTLSDGSISPVFSSATSAYNASVSSSSVTITWTTGTSNTVWAGLTTAGSPSVYNGSGSYQVTTGLDTVGDSVAIQIVVNPQLGASAVPYLITLTRTSTVTSGLTALTLNSTPLTASQLSSAGASTYNMSATSTPITIGWQRANTSAGVGVQNQTTSWTTVTPYYADTSVSVDLVVGYNTIVVSASGVTYTVGVTLSPAANTSTGLTALSLDSNPVVSFNPTIFVYSQTVPSATTYVTIGWEFTVNGTVVVKNSTTGSGSYNPVDNLGIGSCTLNLDSADLNDTILISTTLTGDSAPINYFIHITRQ